MHKYKRALIPLAMVLGTLICAYAAFFVGIKEDFPQPSGSERFPLSLTKQTTVINQWPETAALKGADVSVYSIRETPPNAASYYRDAFVNKRGWKEVRAPAQPKELGPDENFTMLAFNRGNYLVYIGLTNARPVNAFDTPLNAALRGNSIRDVDNIALVVAGQK